MIAGKGFTKTINVYRTTIIIPEKIEMTKSEFRNLVSEITKEVKKESEIGEDKFGPFHSLHDAWAYLREQSVNFENEVFWRENKDETDTGPPSCESVVLRSAAIRTIMAKSSRPTPESTGRGT